MTILNIYINNESCLESELLVSIAQVDSRFSNILCNVISLVHYLIILNKINKIHRYLFTLLMMRLSKSLLLEA